MESEINYLKEENKKMKFEIRRLTQRYEKMADKIDNLNSQLEEKDEQLKLQTQVDFINSLKEPDYGEYYGKYYGEEDLEYSDATPERINYYFSKIFKERFRELSEDLAREQYWRN